jgi:pantetheine-phosphate adenylyltransferase
LVKPLIFLTNWIDAARISSSVTGGSKLNSGLMLLHMALGLQDIRCSAKIGFYPQMTASKTSIVAIYPGSFDPITNGHLDLISRGSRLVDRLVVAILKNETKQPLFSVAERVEMLEEVVKPYPNVGVGAFEGLLVDYAAARGANLIIRGIRAISDYEYELQMALMNRRLRPDIETAFLMAGEAYSFLSSKMVKEVASLGGDVAGLVPPIVEARLKKRLTRGAG